MVDINDQIQMQLNAQPAAKPEKKQKAPKTAAAPQPPRPTWREKEAARIRTARADPLTRAALHAHNAWFGLDQGWELNGYLEPMIGYERGIVHEGDFEKAQAFMRRTQRWVRLLFRAWEDLVLLREQRGGAAWEAKRITANKEPARRRP